MPRPKAYGHTVIGILFLLLALPGVLRADTEKLLIRPDSVEISTLFSGAYLDVSARIPPGSRAVVEIIGKKIEEELMRKSRHWDLWMNSGEVDIENVPVLYFALSSDPRLLTAAAPAWGYAFLEKQARFLGRVAPVEEEGIFDQFVALKERDKLYRLYPGGLEISRPSPGHWQVRGRFRLPSRVKPGTYKVVLSIVQGGKVIQRRTASFKVALRDLPAFLSSLAQRHGIIYGLMAVGLALTAGMLCGLIFRRKGAAH